MISLQTLLGNRILVDEQLRERAGQEYDALTAEQRRTAYIHQARVIHEIIFTLQLASDSETTFRDDRDLLRHIEALAWSTDGTA